jgi:phospho-N-acetylmuramoyl-pentapeptide-transferase
MGGIIIWGTVLGIAVVFWILDALFDGFFGYFNFIDRAQTYLPLAAFFFAALLGLIDDILGSMRVGPNGGGLPVRGKLVVYTLFSMVGAWWFYTKLGFTEIHVPFFGTYDIGFWYVLVFMFAIIASAFSANETDGLDGLLGGVSLFAYGALIVVAFVIGRYDLATMGAAIVGALLAFLWFNIYPAKFFMGDTGSMALGITIGVIAMLTNTILLLPFFAAILVFESLSVIIQLSSKKIRGKKVFRSTPIHHHFEAIGWPESQITMRFWIVSVVFVALGLFIFFIDRLL